MLIHTDTGVLLRLLDRADPQHPFIRQALRALRTRGDEPVTSPQNLAEFWNVCTRPAAARGGFGLSVQETERRVRLLERLFRVLPDSAAAYHATPAAPAGRAAPPCPIAAASSQSSK